MPCGKISLRAVITDVQSHAIQMEYWDDDDLGAAIARHRFYEHQAHGAINKKDGIQSSVMAAWGRGRGWLT